MKLRKKLLPFIILSIGIAGFLLLLSAREQPKRIERVHLGPLVEVIEAPKQRIQVVVNGQGTVKADAEISIVPQVSGTVVWKNDGFKSGGAFSKGDLLLRIDPRDHELALKRATAQVIQASYHLELEKQESTIAKKEWERLHGLNKNPSNLVLRKPQMRSAEAALISAEAGLEEVELRLERTHLNAPFSGRVRSINVDIGQHVNAGQPIAQIYSIERAEIVVPIPNEDLAWFTLPTPIVLSNLNFFNKALKPNNTDSLPHSILNYDEQGSKAVITGTFAGANHTWNGKVTRTEGELDPQSRMARLVVEVDNPYEGILRGAPPLTIGMFVDVAIIGRYVNDARIIPNNALRQNDTVWVVSSNGTLNFRPAKLLRRVEENLLIQIDMGPNERIIVSQLRGVTDGMAVRILNIKKDIGS